MGRWFTRIAAEFRLGLVFYTRLPIGNKSSIEVELARVLWTGPLVGAIIALIGALAYTIAYEVGLPPLADATLATAAMLLVTGCLHEDGLADVADGFGGGSTRERKLEIMRDSRIGTYGVCALTMAVLLRVGLIAGLAEPINVFSALLGAHAASRAVIPVFMALVPAARTDGLSASAGRPPAIDTATALALGFISLGLGLGLLTSIIALVLIGLGSGVIAWLCLRQIGGQTGDVLGALQQVSEVLILISAAIRVGTSY